MRSAVGFVGDFVGQSMWLTRDLVRCALWSLQMLRNRVPVPIGLDWCHVAIHELPQPSGQ